MNWKDNFPKENRYFESNNVILYLGDCSNYLKKFKDNSVDIIITDPPYNINYANYDNTDIFFELEKEYYRILKPNSWFIFWWSTKRIPEISKLKLFKYKWMIICWFHSTYSKSVLGDRTFAPIFVYAKGEPKIVYRRTDSILAEELPIVQTKIKSGDFKPTFALSQLLLIFTKEGNIVLDPFMGFGSLGLVCKMFNRNFIGIEKDEIRFKIAKKIIEEEKITKSIPDYIEFFSNKKAQNKLF